ncbi:MAG: hypothetical protein ACR2QE_15155 [Acidimicrobiales bacterium]
MAGLFGLFLLFALLLEGTQTTAEILFVFGYCAAGGVLGGVGALVIGVVWDRLSTRFPTPIRLFLPFPVLVVMLAGYWLRLWQGGWLEVPASLLTATLVVLCPYWLIYLGQDLVVLCVQGGWRRFTATSAYRSLSVPSEPDPSLAP